MHSNSERRVHSAEFKAAVLQQCRLPGASISAVALAHGLNANLVRKWLVGRGLKRAGLGAARPSPERSLPMATARAPDSAAVAGVAGLQFIPVELASAAAADGRREALVHSGEEIHIELRRGAAQLAVRWPASQSCVCASWLGELARAVLK